MKKKVWKLLLIGVLLLALALFCVACTGERGAQGPQGEKGETGAQGLAGPRGERGEDGASGKDAIAPQIRINEQSGEWEVSTDSGNTWTTTGVVAKGEKGETGATGLQGPQGEQGEKGEDGATGPQGTPGDDAHQHTWGAWQISTQPTCDVLGIETRECACGSVETKLIPAKSHIYGDFVVLKTETCSEDGWKYHVCDYCDHIEFVIIHAKHIWSTDWTSSAEKHWHECRREGCEEIDEEGNHVFENDSCKSCGFCKYIYFGEYPQTIKMDDVTVTDTQDSRGYFLGSDGCYYAKITADPHGIDYTFSDGSDVTDGTEYYFKVESIRWRILSQNSGTAMILCDSIIANKAFDSGSDSSNNYAESDIRAWLNDQFYNTAFTELERELILTTTVDNSVASTGDSANPFACENTEDKVFLLSYAEATNAAYGFSPYTRRKMQTSDYSRATGVSINGSWWLRSPYYYGSDLVHLVQSDGLISFDNACDTQVGVVPTLQIRLS